MFYVLCVFFRLLIYCDSRRIISVFSLFVSLFLFLSFFLFLSLVFSLVHLAPFSFSLYFLRSSYSAFPYFCSLYVSYISFIVSSSCSSFYQKEVSLHRYYTHAHYFAHITHAWRRTRKTKFDSRSSDRMIVACRSASSCGLTATAAVKWKAKVK